MQCAIAPFISKSIALSNSFKLFTFRQFSKAIAYGTAIISSRIPAGIYSDINKWEQLTVKLVTQQGKTANILGLAGQQQGAWGMGHR